MGGPAGQRDQEQAQVGAIWAESHRMRTVRSSPDLQLSASNMIGSNECHPLSTELRRWETLAQVTKTTQMNGIEVPERPSPTMRHEPEGSSQGLKGLVNFPKYMLINNCHLKQMELQRFQRQQQEEAERHRAEVEAAQEYAFRPGRSS